MDYSIQIVDRFSYHGSVVFGLEIEAPAGTGPLSIGCSLRTRSGQLVDLPARTLKSPGLALWEIKGTDEFFDREAQLWSGFVIFAIWRDTTFSQRLGDTGWEPWQVPWLIGSSTAGLDMQDEQIEAKYGARLTVWADGRRS